MNVKLITLKTNHALMGDVTENDNDILIKEPVQVVTVPPKTQNDQGGIAFAPFLEYSLEFKTGIKINKNDILTTVTPMVELENQYSAIFGSGIQITSTIK